MSVRYAKGKSFVPWYIRQRQTAALAHPFVVLNLVVPPPSQMLPPLRSGAEVSAEQSTFSDKPNRASVVNVVSTGSLTNDKGKHSRRKNLGKSWKQILVEHWTSHYFSLCLQMLLATVSSAKGQNKGACHRTANLPSLSLSLSFPILASTLTFSLSSLSLSRFFSFSLCFCIYPSSSSTPPPPLSPTTVYHLLPTRSSISALLPFRPRFRLVVLSPASTLRSTFLPSFLLAPSPPCPYLSPSFLCWSLNYWKQNGLKTKTQADIA